MNVCFRRDTEIGDMYCVIYMQSLYVDCFFIDPRFSYRFTTVLLRVIYRNFLEKESQALEEQKWFHDEAASGKNIQDCGTFRRALSYRIEKEVIPVLSHVISQVDVNSNLDLLTENDEWKRALWLEFFASEEFLHLDQLSTVKLEPMKRKKTDVSLVCWFPFSSAIRNKMTSIIQTHLKDGKYTVYFIQLPFHDSVC